MPTFGAERPFYPDEKVLKKTKKVKIAKAIGVNIATLAFAYFSNSLANEIAPNGFFDPGFYNGSSEAVSFSSSFLPYVQLGGTLAVVAAGIGYSIVQKANHAKEKASYFLVNLLDNFVSSSDNREEKHLKPEITNFDVPIDVYKKNIWGFKSKKTNEGSICLVVQKYRQLPEGSKHFHLVDETIKMDGLSDTDFASKAMEKYIPRPSDIKFMLQKTRPYASVNSKLD